MNDVAERSITFSLQLIRNEGISMKGEVLMKSSVPPRASRLEEITLTHEDAVLPSPRSVLRHRPINQEKNTTPLAKQPVRTRSFMVPLLKTVLVVLCLCLLGDIFGYPAWVSVNTQMTYGRYPTDHLDANVGHGGTSHFVSYMVENRVTVIEILGTKTYVYQLPVNQGGTRLVAMHTVDTSLGKNIVLTIEGTLQEPMLINTGHTFEWSVQK